MMLFLVAISAIAVAVASTAFYALGHRAGYKQAVAHSISDMAMRKALGGDRFKPASLTHDECGGGLWGKWEIVTVVSREPVTSRAGQILREVEVDGQKRTCDQCGFSELRKLTVTR